MSSRLVLTVQDDESGIQSITCTIYDATLKFDVWTTTQDAERLHRAHTDDVEPEEPDSDSPSNPERRERV